MATRKKNSLVENINRRRRAGKSRPKSRSTIAFDAYDQMERGWPAQRITKKAKVAKKTIKRGKKAAKARKKSGKRGATTAKRSPTATRGTTTATRAKTTGTRKRSRRPH